MTHPVNVGPAITKISGLRTRKAMTVFLYQSGACPKKFCQKEFNAIPVMLYPYEFNAFTELAA
jgi:hypothetical protein